MFSEDDKRKLEEATKVLGDIPPFFIPSMDVVKYSSYTPFSEEILMDEGVIPDTREPYESPKLSNWFRLKWYVGVYVRLLRLRVGARIAGIKPDDWDNY